MSMGNTADDLQAHPISAREKIISEQERSILLSLTFSKVYLVQSGDYVAPSR